MVYSEEVKLGLNSQNIRRLRGWYPNPEKQGWLRRDQYPYKKHLDAVKADARKQQEIMQKVIDSRS